MNMHQLQIIENAEYNRDINADGRSSSNEIHAPGMRCNLRKPNIYGPYSSVGAGAFVIPRRASSLGDVASCLTEASAPANLPDIYILIELLRHTKRYQHLLPPASATASPLSQR